MENTDLRIVRPTNIVPKPDEEYKYSLKDGVHTVSIVKREPRFQPTYHDFGPIEYELYLIPRI